MVNNEDKKILKKNFGKAVAEQLGSSEPLFDEDSYDIYLQDIHSWERKEKILIKMF